MRRTPSQENGSHGRSLAAEIGSLLPTPVARDAHGARQQTALNPRNGEGTSPTLSDLEYRWNGAATAPRSNTGPRYTENRPGLSPGFVEWMLGAPQGWTDPDCLLSATEFSSKQGSFSAA